MDSFVVRRNPWVSPYSDGHAEVADEVERQRLKRTRWMNSVLAEFPLPSPYWGAVLGGTASGTMLEPPSLDPRVLPKRSWEVESRYWRQLRWEVYEHLEWVRTNNLEPVRETPFGANFPPAYVELLIPPLVEAERPPLAYTTVSTTVACAQVANGDHQYDRQYDHRMYDQMPMVPMPMGGSMPMGHVMQQPQPLVHMIPVAIVAGPYTVPWFEI